MAGRSHWSAAFKPLDDRLGFRAELACRVNESLEWLGSSYALEKMTDVSRENQGTDGEAIVWQVTDQSKAVFTTDDEWTRIAVNDSGIEIGFRPARSDHASQEPSPASKPTPFTATWSYDITFLDA